MLHLFGTEGFLEIFYILISLKPSSLFKNIVLRDFSEKLCYEDNEYLS